MKTRDRRAEYLKNRDKIKERSKRWRIKNPERYKAAMKAFAAKNAEKIKLYKRAYGKTKIARQKSKLRYIVHREKALANAARYRIVGPIKPKTERQWLKKALAMNRLVRRVLQKRNLDPLSLQMLGLET